MEEDYDDDDDEISVPKITAYLMFSKIGSHVNNVHCTQISKNVNFSFFIAVLTTNIVRGAFNNLST